MMSMASAGMATPAKPMDTPSITSTAPIAGRAWLHTSRPARAATRARAAASTATWPKRRPSHGTAAAAPTITTCTVTVMAPVTRLGSRPAWTSDCARKGSMAPLDAMKAKAARPSTSSGRLSSRARNADVEPGSPPRASWSSMWAGSMRDTTPTVTPAMTAMASATQPSPRE